MDNNLLSIILRIKDEATDELKKINGQFENTKSGIEGWGKSMMVAGGMMTAAGLVGMGAMKGWLDLAADAQEEITVANAQLKNYANSSKADFGTLSESIKKVSDSYIRLGFDDETTYASMVKNYGKTNDLALAQQVLAAEMDLARGKGIDLSSATDLVTKALGGNTTLLKKAGIELKDNATLTDILAAINKKFGGTAEAASSTYKVAMERMNIEIKNVKEALGDRLIPTVTQFVTKISGLIDQLNKVNPKFFDMAVKGIALATAFLMIGGPILFIIGLMTKFGAIIGGVMSSTMLPAIAIIALVAAAAFLLYKAWTTNFMGIQQIAQQFWTFLQPILVQVAQYIQTHIPVALEALHKIIMTVFTWIKTNVVPIFVAIWNEISKFWTIIMPLLGPALTNLWAIFFTIFSLVFNFVIGVLTGLWNAFVSWLSIVAGIFQTGFNVLMLIFDLAWGLIKTIILLALSLLSGNFSHFLDNLGAIWGSTWNLMKEHIAGVGEGIKNIVKGMVNYVIDLINILVNAVNGIKFSFPGMDIGGHKIAAFNFGGFNIPTIPHVSFDTGGWVNGSGMAMVHDGEFVLSRDMMAGKSPVDSKVFNNNNSKKIEITAIINNPADWDQMLNKLSWKLNYSY